MNNNELMVSGSDSDVLAAMRGQNTKREGVFIPSLRMAGSGGYKKEGVTVVEEGVYYTTVKNDAGEYDIVEFGKEINGTILSFTQRYEYYDNDDKVFPVKTSEVPSNADSFAEIIVYEEGSTPVKMTLGDFRQWRKENHLGMKDKPLIKIIYAIYIKIEDKVYRFDRRLSSVLGQQKDGSYDFGKPIKGSLHHFLNSISGQASLEYTVDISSEIVPGGITYLRSTFTKSDELSDEDKVANAGLWRDAYSAIVAMESAKLSKKAEKVDEVSLEDTPF